MKQPIPDTALDDRLGFVGTAGSGKSYNAMGRVERLLAKHARVCCVDPLGVFWGLRLQEDGKTESGFNIPIFGGPHGDLPLTEHSGALIGETVAGMAESCIIDLSEIGTKNGERRFMLHFLTALYRKSKDEPLHLVVDEADMFAPQKLTDKEGEAAKLLGMMETVVRRGRIKGFIPWLITQRPAVIAKDVLSQVDGLVAFKLTSSQDRDALSAWVEGSAEKEDWKTMRAALPAMERGQGVVWIPGRGIMETVIFPPKATFDSSRTPKRGEKKSTASLRPLDLSKLKERLAVVDAETKANDPKALKAEIAKLIAEKAVFGRQMAQAVAGKVVEDPEKIAKAEQRGYRNGFEDAKRQATVSFDTLKAQVRATVKGFASSIDSNVASERIAFEMHAPESGSPPDRPSGQAPMRAPEREPAQRKPSPEASGDGSLSGPQRKIVEAINFWHAVGTQWPTREQVAAVAGYSARSGSFRNTVSFLNVAGFISGDQPGCLALNGRASSLGLQDIDATTRLKSILSGPETKIVGALQGPVAELSRQQVADDVGYSAESGSFRNTLSSLHVKDVIRYPSKGTIALTDWARQVLG